MCGPGRSVIILRTTSFNSVRISVYLNDIANFLYPSFIEMAKRKARDDYCMLLVTSSSHQVSDVRTEMRQRALFITGRAAWRCNRMRLSPQNVKSTPGAIIVPEEPNFRCASGC